MAGDFSCLTFHGIGKAGLCNVIYCECVLSHVQFFATSWTAARQAPLSMGFPRQDYWSGFPFPPPGDPPRPGIEPMSPALAKQVLYHSATWEALVNPYALSLFTVRLFQTYFSNAVKFCSEV